MSTIVLGFCHSCGRDLQPGENLVVGLCGKPLRESRTIRFCPKCAGPLLQTIGVEVSARKAPRRFAAMRWRDDDELGGL